MERINRWKELRAYVLRKREHAIGRYEVQKRTDQHGANEWSARLGVYADLLIEMERLNGRKRVAKARRGIKETLKKAIKGG